MSANDAVVYLIDDEASVRRALRRLLTAAGLNVQEFPSGEAFLGAQVPDRVGCIILDVRMPGIDGLAMQEQLVARTCALPIIFLSAHGSVHSSVQAMRAGAVTFLEKPPDRADLLAAVHEALDRDRVRRAHGGDLSVLRERYGRLTPRESEVLVLVAMGLTSRQISYRLGTTKKTIQAHRAAIMAKMEADSVAEVTRMAEHLGLPPPLDPQ